MRSEEGRNPRLTDRDANDDIALRDNSTLKVDEKDEIHLKSTESAGHSASELVTAAK